MPSLRLLAAALSVAALAALPGPATAAEITSPEDGAVVTERPELRWRLGPGEESRRVVIYTESGGHAQPARAIAVGSDDTSVVVDAPLAPGTWWWRVEGRRFVISATASAERRFVVPE
ncbi:MAG TPA: hypothetical protein VNT32_01945, partial [Thermoleophilaceae bacterium]|nr:hypothetical protein [Thermoleophilaceae bacterium]